MKKLFYAFVCVFTAAPFLCAASTCETRVDKHQNASTAERVDYCLTEEPEQDTPPATEVVLSDVYSVQYPAPKTAKPAEKTQEIKRFTPGPTSMEYLDRDDYPAFRNDTLPLFNEDEAHETALEALSAQVPQENTGKKSLTKPGRVMKSVPEATPTVTDTASYGATGTDPYGAYASAYEAAYGAPGAASAGAPAYDAQTYGTTQPAQAASAVQTPAGEIQQAQNLQNDPLYQNNTAGGAAPAGFTDGGVMGQDSFGYNATDPAYQP